jgi:hypothetical protein
MKRTQARKILATGLFQLDVVADDPDDIGLLLNAVSEITRIGHEWNLNQLQAASNKQGKQAIAPPGIYKKSQCERLFGSGSF